MDIIQARKKARELEDKKKFGLKKARKSAQAKSAAKKKASAKRKAVAKKGGAKKKAPAEKKAPSKEETVVQAAPKEVEDVKREPSRVDEIFMDLSFGEDLPAGEDTGDLEGQPQQVHLDTDDFDAKEPGGERAAPPAAPEPHEPEPAPAVAPEPAAPPRPEPAFKPELKGDRSDAGFFLAEDEADDKDFFELVEDDLYRQGFGDEAAKDIGPQLELLSFEIGQETYAVPLTSIQQITKMKEITMVPRAPGFISGVLSLRGTVLPIFDLRKRLGLEARPSTRDTRIIVVMVDGMSSGLIVDRVRQVVRIPEDSLEEPPAMLGAVETDFLDSIGRFDHKMLIILNLSKVIDIHSSFERGKVA